MRYQTARAILEMQDRNIRKVNGIRMIEGNYEYRATYYGKFGAYFGIDRRVIGKRNFKFFCGVSADKCKNVCQVINLLNDEIKKHVAWENGLFLPTV